MPNMWKVGLQAMWGAYSLSAASAKPVPVEDDPLVDIQDTLAHYYNTKARIPRSVLFGLIEATNKVRKIAPLAAERTALTGTEMMFILSDIYDGGKSRGIKFAKDPMLMVGQLFNILERSGTRFIRIDAQERAASKSIDEEPLAIRDQDARTNESEIDAQERAGAET